MVVPPHALLVALSPPLRARGREKGVVLPGVVNTRAERGGGGGEPPVGQCWPGRGRGWRWRAHHVVHTIPILVALAGNERDVRGATGRALVGLGGGGLRSWW